MPRASQHLEYDVARSLLAVLSDCELSCPDYLVVNLVRLLNQHLCIGNRPGLVRQLLVFVNQVDALRSSRLDEFAVLDAVPALRNLLPSAI